MDVSPIAVAVAQHFDLGEPLAPLRAVEGGRSHLMWRLRTTAGDWAVKQLNRSREQWWSEDYLIAVQIEQCALEQALPMPRPRAPLVPALPLLADIEVGGTLVSFRVHEWLDVRPSTTPFPVDARWVGETLARLHRLPVDLDPADANQYETYGAEDWCVWLDESPEDVPRAFIDSVRAYLPDVAHAKDIVDAACHEIQEQAAPVFTHRDVKPDNVLMTACGPVLVDWDSAGLDLAQPEALRTALAFSREPGGWNGTRFEAVVRAYLGAGGVPIPAAPSMFGAVLRGRLGSAAFQLWRALGYRPTDTAERVRSYGDTHEQLAELRASLAALKEWTRWLSAAVAS